MVGNRDTGGIDAGTDRGEGSTSTPGVRPPIIILSGIRWDFLWQRQQTLAILFARGGYPTVYVETTGLANPHPDRATARKVLRRIFRAGAEGYKARGSVLSNLTVYSPLVTPPTWKIFRRLNRAVFVPRVVRDLRHLLKG